MSNGFFGSNNNCCSWILILVVIWVLFSCCGNTNNGCGCDECNRPQPRCCE